MERSQAADVVSQWSNLDEAVRHWAQAKPGAAAFVEPAGRMTWRAYDEYISLLGAELVEAGVAPGEQVGIWLPDGAAVHVAFSACLRAGIVFVAIGARSGPRELRHLLGRASATTLITTAQLGRIDTRRLFAELSTELPLLTRYLDVDEIVPAPRGLVETAGDHGRVVRAERRVIGRRRPTDQLAFLNSTSGTTGRPKCVAHDERRWLKYHEYAVDAGGLTTADVCMSLVPAPFGFGLWTAHFTPTLLGAPTVVVPRFDSSVVLDLLAGERVTVLMAVSTQFIMLLGESGLEHCDLSALRVLFTGGEAVPYSKAAEFEERAGAAVLNMYGSNETGVLSYTTLSDSRERRLATGGRIIPEVAVRLYDDDGAEIGFGSGPGRPASIGTVRSQGYYEDPAGNAELFTPDGWMLMGDLVTIDRDGYLTVVGRTSDFVIRGGKNISAAAVEAEVITHPAVLRCAAVAMPDEVFGERVCIYLVLKHGGTVTLAGLTEFLAERGVSKEWFPEHLIVVAELPTSDGGKLAKAALRADLRTRLGLPND